MSKKPVTRRRVKRQIRVGTICIAVIVVLALALNILTHIFRGYVDTYLGQGSYSFDAPEGTEDWDTQYSKSDFSTKEESDANADRVVREIANEGIVLLKNESNALPLDNGAKITLLGAGAADPIYGGSGSGMTSAEPTNLHDGLAEAGFQINETVYNLLADYVAVDANKRGEIAMDKPAESTYQIGEMPVANYTDEAVASFAEYSDAAVVVIARPAGEGGDLTRDMSGFDDNYVEGQHQLELNQDERDVIDLAKSNFDRVVVLVNMSTTFELGDLQNDPEVDAILDVPGTGQSGFISLGHILNGDVNPSGHTTDLWSADFTQDPTFVNFGDYTYNNVAMPEGRGSDGSAHFVNYAEGIYVGYRYYETAAEEGFLDYDQAVVYPFGYGLSYTTFDWQIADSTLPADASGEISVDVTVTNTGDVAGKDVVELYYSAPYTPGGIEKSSVVLGTFEKTDLLQPGQSQTVTLSIPVEEMASYDYKDAGAYVLDQGDYLITVRTDSHTVAPGTQAITYTLPQTITYDQGRDSDLVPATNQFDDVSAMFTDSGESGKVTEFSRSDFAGTFPTAPGEDVLNTSQDVIDGMAPYDPTNEPGYDEATAPATGQDSDLTLVDMRGLDYDDPAWDELLDSLDPADVQNMLLTGAYNTAAINSIAKPYTNDPDGPAGISSFMNPDKLKGAAYPAEYMIAQTWNRDLAEQMGAAVANETYFLDLLVSGWYAPAANTHRSPFAGRNFEYYSEDGELAGEIATAVIEGCQDKGVYVYLKHFAMNDQETNRANSGLAVWANEQAIREIYLKPFEIAVKNVSTEVSYISDDQGNTSTTTVGVLGIMSSFNRIGTTWAGGSTALLTDVLRDEWGYQGMVITDFNLTDYMSADQGIYAGSDLMLSMTGMKTFDDTDSNWALQNQRKSAKNILYTVAHSKAMNGLVSGSTIQYHMATWEIGRIVIDVILVAGLALWGVALFRKSKTLDSLPEESAAR